MYQIDQIEVTWHKAASMKDLNLMMTPLGRQRHVPDRHGHLFREGPDPRLLQQAAPFQQQNVWVDETPAFKARHYR